MWSLLQATKRFWARGGDVAGACVLAAFAIYFLSGRFTTVRFDRERIDVEVEEGLIHVHGLYHYRNTSRLPAVLTLGIPFPVDRDHPAPDAWALAEVHEDGRLVRGLTPRGQREEPRVRVFFRPGEAKWIQLDYWQPAHRPEGVYLLTTTRAWRRPITQASFRLLLPPGFQLKTSNYPVRELPGSHRSTSFTFSMTEFFPDQDWRFSWRELRSVSARRTGGVP
ncbi:MAG: hypothetical protein ABSA41_09260 [Terriglobia bacterium]|jgi:hypothetical protein